MGEQNEPVLNPNLFAFMKRELSHDAVLGWLLSWAKNECRAVNPRLGDLGSALLKSIYSKARADFSPPSSLKVLWAEPGINIICLIDDDMVIIVVNKVGTKEDSDQLSRYRECVATWPNVHKFIPVYVQTSELDDYAEITKHGYTILERRDILAILESPEGRAASAGSDILSDFSAHLHRVEDDVQKYARTPIASWTSESWEGYYAQLKRELYGHCGFFPVPNAPTEFRVNGCADPDVDLYIQLDQGKLSFKISVDDLSKAKELRALWHQKLMAECPKHGLKLTRPGRFTPGKYMTVAVLAQEYRATAHKGLIDMVATCAFIRKAEQLLDACFR